MAQVEQQSHLLASRSTPSDVVIRAIREAAKYTTAPVLDVGSGDGRLVGFLPNHLRVIVLDRDIQVLRDSTADSNLRLAGDALSLPFRKKSLGMVLSVNVAHEVCAAPSEGERIGRFKDFIHVIQNTLKPGAELVLFDGIMPDNFERTVTLSPNSAEARELFDEFRATYTGRALSIQYLSSDTVRLPFGDVITFLTKYPYINGPYWEDERTQLYPFLSVQQMKKILGESGFELVSVEHPTERKGLPDFLRNYTVGDYDVENFPPVQVAIRAKRKIDS